jgi:hypothetical protein
MKSVVSKRDLVTCTEKYVHVQRDNCIYLRVHDEYVMKMYFDVQDAADILGVPVFQVHKLCRKFGIQAPVNKRKKLRIRLSVLQQMAQTT